MDVEQSNKMELLLDQFEYLKKSYVDIILNMIDYSMTKNILPMKIYFMINYMKKYINDNEIEIIESGINYLIPNKDDILNFNINNLDEIEDCFIKKNINNNNLNNSNNNSNNNEIIKLIVEIKENSKKLNKVEIDTIKKYVELIISILEKIKILYE
jgi:hypothetical protein